VYFLTSAALSPKILARSSRGAISA